MFQACSSWGLNTWNARSCCGTSPQQSSSRGSRPSQPRLAQGSSCQQTQCLQQVGQNLAPATPWAAERLRAAGGTWHSSCQTQLHRVCHLFSTLGKGWKQGICDAASSCCRAAQGSETGPQGVWAKWCRPGSSRLHQKRFEYFQGQSSPSSPCDKFSLLSNGNFFAATCSQCLQQELGSFCRGSSARSQASSSPSGFPHPPRAPAVLAGWEWPQFS